MQEWLVGETRKNDKEMQEPPKKKAKIENKQGLIEKHDNQTKPPHFMTLAIGGGINKNNIQQIVKDTGIK